MPDLAKNPAGTKRKREDPGSGNKRRVARKHDASEDENAQDQILELETDIVKSGDYRPGIQRILEIFSGKDHAINNRLAAAVALCRIFYRLITGELLVKRKASTPEERETVESLRALQESFVERLCKLLGHKDEHVRSTALALLMRVVKAEVSQQESRSLLAWKKGTFYILVRTLITKDGPQDLIQEFLESFVEAADDVRYYTFGAVAQILGEVPAEQSQAHAAENSLQLLLGIEGVPESDDHLEDWYGVPPGSSSRYLQSVKAHRKEAQAAWLKIFSSPLDKSQRKQILDLFTDRVVPWFSQPETLMDFLTDSYNEGGATSLLALSGVYYLINQKNLDYPQFYTKLYSLLDAGILHSKHRARFFRLLDTFLSSTHLPANLVASFMKRLARLALSAPPGGIVMVIPWIYNMLMKHRQCTFMIHREIRDPMAKEELESLGMDDPFDMDETDPGNTNAIDSSLWELHTLQSHYHPNVATLAKIISEQFTKQEYNLEDFLDHSYNGLVEAELGKELKKAPVVVYEIPKRIITKEDGTLNEAGQLLQQALACT